MKNLLGLLITGMILFGITGVVHAQNNMLEIAVFYGEHYDSSYGYSMVSLDFNHDSYDDLIVCSFSYGYVSGESPSRGKVYVYFGGSGFSSSTPASVTLTGTVVGNTGRRIWAIYNVGDISGDGYEDLCIYIEDVGEGEKLLFFYGGDSDLNNPDNVFIEPYGSSIKSVYKIGDFNGDGLGEIGLDHVDGTRRISMLLGGSYQECIVSQGEASPSYSRSINGIGDINGDGYADFTTGFAVTSVSPPYNLIRLYYGNAQGDTSNPIVLIQISGPISRISYPLGDINGDGYDDFMGYGTNSGIDVWMGGQNVDLSIPGLELSPPRYGGGVAFGDFNGDGFSDVVGSSYNDRLFSIWLGKQHVNGTEDWCWGQNYENFGYRIATGDFNADGYDDIAASAPTQYGYVWVYGGNAQLADTTVANDDPVAPELKSPLNLSITPNPVSVSRVEVSVRLECKEHNPIVRIDVFNLKGQRVLSKNITHGSDISIHRIELPALAAGIYICRSKVGQRTITCKFCITK